MTNYHTTTNHLYLIIPSTSMDCTPLISPKHLHTGSNFTERKSGRSNRSKYSSNSKLLKSSLFRSIRNGSVSVMQGLEEQKDMEI